ncbi:hypothetical protein THRCLA_08108 [Thraustotheca clavata]|uniref:Uncharacterized protein n=1 Tax=Thraustotheca clavata TaxID=74557 RepID=A0A1V9Z9P8_9STRA|nr:hypothetical protein THRCLA_08108 [Thraustotheca clavata]
MVVKHLDKYRHESMMRDILDELVFLEFLDDWKNLDRVVMKDELIELLDNFSISFRCTPHFENWWRLLDDKDLGRKYIANRLKIMSILQGHGDSRHPYVWHRRALDREINDQTQLRMDKGISKTLTIPLTYEEAFKYDVFKWTQVAMHVLRTREVWMTANLIGQAKNIVPRAVDPKEYATAVINEMKKDPRMTFSIDVKDRGVFSKASAFMESVTITVEAAVAKFTDMALLALEKVARFPVTTIWMEARRRHGFPCLRYKTKRDSLAPEEEEDQKYVEQVVEGMRRDPRLEFVDASDMTQRFFCLPPPMRSSGHASIATSEQNEGPRIVPISVPLGAEEAAVKFTKKALKYLQSHPRYYISTIREATQFCLPPQWTHDQYVDYIVERLRSER